MLMAGFDPLLVEVIKNEFSAINEEMAISIARTGRSVMVKMGDSATTIADAKGRLISEAASVFRTGTLMSTLDGAIDKFGGAFRPGDIVLVNDPYSGMGHMPDCAIIAPVFWRGELVAFTPVYSHHTDIGGRFPGGFSSASREAYEEGLRIPPVKLYDAGKRNDATVDIISANVRNADEWFGDINAKIAGCRKGAAQMCALLDKYGLSVYTATCDYLQQHTERATRAAIRAIPDGTYSVENYFEEDGLGTPDVRLPVRISLRADDDELTIDLTGSAPQARGAINVPLGMTKGAIYGAVRAIIGRDLIINSGLVRPLKIVIPEGSIFNPRFPAATGGRASLFFHLMDSLFRCLAKALPQKVGVLGEAGDLIHFSGLTADHHFESFIDSFAGGWGGRPNKDGIDAVYPVSFGTVGSTPVELLEREHPIVVESFGILPDTEGAGKYRGSLSTYRQWRFLAPGKVMVRSNRLTRPSEGLAGGCAGALARNIFECRGIETPLPPMSHQSLQVAPGDRLRHVVGGCGGYGDPLERDPQRVLEDVIAEKISVKRALEQYGVAVDFERRTIDWVRTETLRRKTAATAASAK
jgi:N-methylhydantoinase B